VENQIELIPDSGTPIENRSGFRHAVVDIFETILLTVILFAGINTVSARVRVDGSSMEPTFHNGEFIIVNKLPYKFGSPQRGDVIVFHPPRDPEEEYIKRVIGTPGDKIEVAGGQVYVNGQPIQETYITAQPTYSGSWSVPENAILVLGDNRNNSSDSHNWGPVLLNEVIGKAVLVYWPPAQWGIIEHFSIASAAH
jgi:signal peptidase I